MVDLTVVVSNCRVCDGLALAAAAAAMVHVCIVHVCIVKE